MVHGKNKAKRLQGRVGILTSMTSTVLTRKNGRGERSELLGQGKWSRNREQQVLSPGVGTHLVC